MDVTHITAGGVLTALLGLVGKFAWRKIQDDRKALHDIHGELVLQRTNCLTTLQSQGREQIEILNSINHTTTEQLGYVRGYVEGKGSEVVASSVRES